LAGARWHRFAFGEAANRTYHHRFKKKVVHVRLSTLTEASNTSNSQLFTLLHGARDPVKVTRLVLVVEDHSCKNWRKCVRITHWGKTVRASGGHADHAGFQAH
jgi:hypothetical protein